MRPEAVRERSELDDTGLIDEECGLFADNHTHKKVKSLK